jgi:META domain
MEATAVGLYDGLYILTSIVDLEIGSEIPIPNDSECTIRMQHSTTGDVNQYDIGVKVGNSMGGSATVTPSLESDTNNKAGISISGLRSTMMMPPPELYRIEVALSYLLPNAETIEIKENILTIKGSRGSVQASRKV